MRESFLLCQSISFAFVLLSFVKTSRAKLRNPIFHILSKKDTKKYFKLYFYESGIFDIKNHRKTLIRVTYFPKIPSALQLLIFSTLNGLKPLILQRLSLHDFLPPSNHQFLCLCYVDICLCKLL